ncbi:hypothetical protein J3R30DRAFT_3400509 [Lentinula aciculospora]|uniref:Mitochondrial carrier n=1 Tax=Lentinula aciculospora TaxID=153920 RepID=A0A9W9DV27_9AGAR|nr:hypothetical protein J3R30DRAFT_3400509 [Lentinula aciculospora]
MEFWPEDKQSHKQGKSKSSGKGKGKISPSGTSYLEPGRLESVTLVENNSCFEWTSPLRSLGGTKLTLGDCVEVFRPTRPPAVHIPSTSIVHRAEQGATFLRTYFPDIDIAAELVREELSADAQATREFEQYDPLSRNVLELLHMPGSPDTRKLIAFPMGVTGSDLNICSLNHFEDNLSFECSINTVKSFTTPILQLVSSRTPANGPNTYLATRTYGSTTLLRACYAPEAPYVAFSELSTITREDIGQRPPVDVKFKSRHPGVLFVNDEGSVHEYSIETGQVRSAYSGFKNPDSGDTFWHMAIAGDSEDGYLLASSKMVQELDLRTDGLALNLLSIATTTGEKLTWIEDPSDNYLVPVVSTERILWLDRRFPGKPLLGITHRRKYDRTLALHAVTIHGTEQLLHIDSPPYSFSIDTGESRSCGDAYVNIRNQYKMLRISERGRLSCADLKQNDNDNDTIPSFAPTQYLPSESNQTPDIPPDLGPVGAREYSKTNLRPAYKQLFPSVVDVDTQEEKDAEAVYDLLEQLPSFWQKEDTSIEQVLTAYDILFRAGEEPGNPSRADFLTETVFNSTRGYRILLQGRLPTQSLADGASWYSDIAPTINYFDESTVGDIRTIAERLRSFNLSPQPEDPVQASRRQTKACEQLAIDLSLSKNIYSSKSFSQTPASDHVDASGSSVHFHYLQPRPNRDHYTKEEQQEDILTLPLGVGLLLEDWDIGTNPAKYIFNEPYGVDAGLSQEKGPQRRMQPVQSQANLPPSSSVPQSQMPPSIAILPIAQPFDLPLRVSDIESQSQMTEPVEVESQVLMTSTQVLPGPFGGRPAAIGKKKPMKKRMGVFMYDRFRSRLPKLPKETAAWWSVSPLSISISPQPARYMDGKRTSDPVCSTVFNDFLGRNKAVVTALSASCISTFAGYPLDSLKSRLQTTKTPISVPRLALTVYRDEGISGFYRGLAIPLLTISFVRAASFTIYNSTKDYFKKREWLARDSIIDVSVIGGISGAMSGALISVGSTPFELVKVRRQLEYTIASSKGIHLAKAPGTLEAVRDIFRTSGIGGLYTGFRLHFTRDTTGTMLYFLEYDGMRYLLGRQRSGEQGPIPSWIPIPISLAPFVCGSFAGVTSWALIYPLDVVKTKVQQRALAGERYRGPFETFHRLIRGPDPNNPKPFLAGVARIYRGLGVSAVRSITTHGLLWTFFDLVANYIDSLPKHR